ncbi:arginase family protein [Pedobacter sp. PAMC26386]|nr:arginase family protein [Pedobacter sp. PAMC26386]
MKTTEQSLRTSKCLNFKEHDDKVEAYNVLNRKRYILTSGVFDILKFLEIPKSQKEILDLLQDVYDEGTIKDTIIYLVENKLIVENDHDETCHVFPTALPLFGIANYPSDKPIQPKIVFTGIPFGKGNGSDSNCMHFPAELRNYLNQEHVNLGSSIDNINFQFLSSHIDFTTLKSHLKGGKLGDSGNLYLYPTEYSSSVYEKIYRTISKLLKEDIIPFTLGGDHSISYPIIRAMNEKYDRFQVLQFDAHIDTYDSIFSRMLDGKISHHHGNFMAKCLKLENLSHVYQYGIRGLSNIRPTIHSKQSYYWIDELYPKVINVDEAAIDHDIPTYITFDIDFLDPQTAPGTATPVPDGFLYRETCDLFEKLLKNSNIVGIDLVEVNPKLDNEKRTLQIAANIILLLLNYIKL